MDRHPKGNGSLRGDLGPGEVLFASSGQGAPSWCPVPRQKAPGAFGGHGALFRRNSWGWWKLHRWPQVGGHLASWLVILGQSGGLWIGEWWFSRGGAVSAAAESRALELRQIWVWIKALSLLSSEVLDEERHLFVLQFSHLQNGAKIAHTERIFEMKIFHGLC